MARTPYKNPEDEALHNEISRASEANRTMPDFNAEPTGRNNASNNWEDQRNQRNKERNDMDIEDAGRRHRRR